MALAAGVPLIPCAVIGTDRAQPPGKYTITRHPVTVRFGRPLDVARYADQAEDPFALRSATDELMYEIMMLSGQEYVDEYASRVKAGEVDVSEGVDGQATPGKDGAVGDGQPSKDARRRAG